MTNFNKSDLQYTHYSWTAYGKDDPKVTGVPDSTLFNRKEGYEVIYMINKVLDKKGLTSVSSGQKVETKIKDKLPGDVRSQKNVLNWLVEHW